jgi:hypothetical protein
MANEKTTSLAACARFFGIFARTNSWRTVERNGERHLLKSQLLVTTRLMNRGDDLECS